MKNIILLFVIIATSILVCHSQEQYLNQPDIDFKNLEKDFPKRWAYYNNHIVLSSDFIAIDNFSKTIFKGEFLSKNPFGYAVIANQQQFLHEEFGINMYPTHIILDRNGVIKKVVNSANEMIIALESNETSVKTKSQLPPPPPPIIP